MSTPYGSPAYGGGPYGGRTGTYTPSGATILIYDRLGGAKGFFQSGIGSFLGLEFVLDENGCNSFTLHFAGYVEIDKTDRIRIFLFDNEDPFFFGVVRSVPIDGSTSQVYDYSGYGMNDYLLRLSTGELTYAGDTIEEIVADLVDSIIVTAGQITKNLLKLQAPATVITSINFHYVSIKAAFEELQKIANADGNEYVFGVDGWGDFFFRPRSTDLMATLHVGRGRYGISSYEPTDSGEQKTKLHVFRDDGTYYGTYISDDADLDIWEEKLTAPKIDDADIDNWATGQLLQLEQVTRSASVVWTIWPQKPLLLTADGLIRVLCARPPTNTTVSGTPFGVGFFGEGLFGGDVYTGFLIDDTLKVKRVTCKLAGKESSRDIELGTVEVDMPGEVIKVYKNIEALRVSSGR
jgi:hypothetical protein